MSEDVRAWNVECKRCGLLPVARTRAAVPVVVAEHWVSYHGPGAAIEGRDWVSYPALTRCDTCAVVVEPPYWTHSTGSPLGEDFGDHDGLWLMCDACHGFFERHDLTGWVKHWVQVSRDLTNVVDSGVVDMAAIRAEVAQRFRMLFERMDAGVRQ